MFLNPRELLAHVHVPVSSRVADFGAGSGEYTFELADRVGRGGAVYALDALPAVVGTVRRKGYSHDADVFALQADLNHHIPLRENLLEFGIAANLLHALWDKPRFAREAARVIAPGGRVLVVEWADSFQNMGPTAKAVVSPGLAVRVFQEAGFKTGNMIPAGTHHYAFIATLPEHTL